jgi:Integrase zinc binding domain
MSRNFTWPSMQAQVTAYVTTCDRCQRNKSPNQRPSGLLQPLEVPDEPWAHVSLDFVMALPPSNGFDAILVVVDKLSKSIVLVPTKTTVTAKETARLYFNKVDCRHGLPRKIISDRDARFTVPSGRNCTAYCKSDWRCPPPSTPRRMARQNGPTARWRRWFAITSPTAKAIGVSYYLPSSSRTTQANIARPAPLPSTPVLAATHSSLMKY